MERSHWSRGSRKRPMGARDVSRGETPCGASDVDYNSSQCTELKIRSTSNMWYKNSSVRFVFAATGIFVCYFFYGILQEKITRGKHGEQQEAFTFTASLVFVQCVVNFCYALLMRRVGGKRGHIDTTSTVYYAACSVTYLVAMVASNKALQWVNYPTQVVGKSCKPIPVMVLGVLLGRKSYPWFKYVFVLLIVTGVATFIYKEGKTAHAEAHQMGFGELLLLLSLTCDGLTGAIQERMKSEHQTSSSDMMVAMNKWSILFLGAAVVFTREIFDFLQFVNRNPQILALLFLFSVTSALGQYFIFMCVSEFGPLPCSIVTTTRKFFTVLASVIIFGNVLSDRQWVGTALVFLGLFLDGAFGKAGRKPVSSDKAQGKDKKH